MTREPLVYRDGHGMIPKSEAHEIDRAKAASLPKRSDFLDTRIVQRGSWVWRDGECVPKNVARHRDAMVASETRSRLPCPYVMSDLTDYTSATGEHISGRAAHREFLNKNGFVEIGNEKMEPKASGPQKGEIAADIKETIEQLEQGYVDPEMGPIGEEKTADLDPVDIPNDVKNGDIIRSEIETETV
jgi:hypothetical protein